MTFKNWMLTTGLSKTSAKKYESAVFGSISTWAIEADLIKSNLAHTENLQTFSNLWDKILELETFKKRNSKGNNMYSAALKKYAAYLKEQGFDLKNDLEKIYKDGSIPETDKERLVNSRLGQGSFRRHLIDMWNGCAVTRYPSTDLLTASHIKPWRNSNNEERLDPYNGLLLIPNLDMAFDKGFISFRKSGYIIISELLESPDTLGIEEDLKIQLSESHQIYLEYHRDTVLLNIS